MKVVGKSVGCQSEYDVHIGESKIIEGIVGKDLVEHESRVTAQRLLLSLAFSKKSNRLKMMRMLVADVKGEAGEKLKSIYLFLQQFRDFSSRTQYNIGDFLGFRLDFM